MKMIHLATVRRRWPVGLLAAMALCSTTWAQAPAKGTPAHITAVVGKVNAAFMQSNAAQTADWPSYGLRFFEVALFLINSK